MPSAPQADNNTIFPLGPAAAPAIFLAADADVPRFTRFIGRPSPLPI